MLNIKKVTSIMLVTVVIAGSLTGCKKDENRDPLFEESKEVLVDMINDGNEQLIESIERITELETMLKGVQGDNPPTPGISEMSDGTGRLTFNSVEGVIKFPVEFIYPGSTQAPNTSSLNISEAIKIMPTSNWIIKMSGTKIELNHSSGVSGMISIGKLDRDAQKTRPENLSEYMSTNFFSTLPPEDITYNKIYINDNWFGMDASSHTFIDEKDARIRCGLIGYGELSIQYFFVYNGEQDSAKDEVILSLIKTFSVWNTQLRVE